MKIGPVYLAKKRNRHKKICEEQSPGGLSMSKLLKEFREFAVQGNMIDMAVGMIIGAAFKDLVNSSKINIHATRCPHCTSVLEDK